MAYSNAITNKSDQIFTNHYSNSHIQNEGTLIGLYEATNITSIAGDKGSDPYTCQNNTSGSNVLSVAFSPNTLTMVSAVMQNILFLCLLSWYYCLMRHNATFNVITK